MKSTKRFLLIVLLLSISHNSLAVLGSKDFDNANGSPLEAVAPGDPTVAITGPTSFCIGSSNAMVTFEAAGGTAPYTFTYQINGGAAQTIQTTGSGSTAQVPVNTNSANVYTYTITGVRNATGRVIDVFASAQINVVQAPAANFTFTGGECANPLVQFTTTVTSIGTYTYTWDFGDGETSIDQHPGHLFNALGCVATSTYPVSLTVSDVNGCSITITKNVTVFQKPDISFSDEDAPFGEPFNNCILASAADPAYAVRVGNTSLSSGCISSYSINWGDGSPIVNNATFPANHTYNRLGSFNMVITARGTNGCTNSVTYVVKNVTNPSVGITSPGTTTNLCAPTPLLQFMIANWGGNSPGTTYSVDYGDGTGITIYTQEQLEATAYYNDANPASSANFPIPHSYTTTNCPNAPYTVTLIATNSCSQTVATVNNITILTPTAPNFTAPLTSCVNTSVGFTNTSIIGYNTSCNPTSTYTWSFGDGTSEVVTTATPRNTTHTYTTPGTYVVELSSRNLCGTTRATQTVTINPAVTASITALASGSATATICQNDATAFITFKGSNGTAPYTFTYRINGGPVQTISSIAPSSTATIPIATGAEGTFTYTLLNVTDGSASACTQAQTGSVVVTVSPPPTATIRGSAAVCLNGTSPTITFSGSGGTAPYTFYYTINGGAERDITTSGTNTSATVQVLTNVAGNLVYTLVRVEDSRTNACNRSADMSATAAVVISTPPAPIALTDREFCAGENTPIITFPNTPSVTYTWTNSNTAIGLGSSGTGNIPSFRTRNSTTNPITATITVTPSINGCDGPPRSFTITVYPPVVVNFSLGNQTICTGDGTQVVALTSTPVGANISWTAIQPAGITGVVTSGNNTIPSQTLVNSTNAPITVTYRATATSPQTSNCAGVEYTYTITVNPVPVVVQSYPLTVCSGNVFSFTPPNGGGNVIPSGIRFTWAAPTISPAGSLTGGSAQNSLQAAISQTLVNTTTSPATATYTVTPIANGCTGVAFTVIVTVLPLPRATITGNATICQNGPATVTFTGFGGTAPYIFTYRINGGATRTATTLSGNSITVDVSTTTAGPYTYTLVSVQESSTSACSQSQAGSVTINVNANPSANISGSTSACLNGTSPVITLTGSGGAAPYTFTYNINGGPNVTIDSQSGNSVNITVPTNLVGIYRYNLVGVHDASALQCSQAFTRSATITINQPPAPLTLTDREFCNGEITPVITFSNTVPGTTYSWTNSNTAIGLTANGNTSIPTFTATNTTSVAINSTITVTPRANGCDGPAQTFRITVHPSTVIFVPGDQNICSGDASAPVTLSSNIAGASLSWTATQPAGITGVALSGTNTIPAQTLINTTNVPITVIYRATATSPVTANCAGVVHDYRITVNPRPVVSVNYAQNHCSGDVFLVNLASLASNPLPSGTLFRWDAPVISPAGSITGASGQTTPVATLSQTLVSTISGEAIATYTVTPIVNGCEGPSFTVAAFVYPLPTAILSGNATVCQDDVSPSVTFTGSGGTTPYTFTYNINGGLNQTITTTSGNSRTIAVPTDVEGSFIYNLVRVSDSKNYGCGQSQTGSATIIVNQRPAAIISGSASVCLNDPATVIFTATSGAAPFIFTYSINGGASQSITTTSGNSISLNVPTTTAGDYTYRLQSVSTASTYGCLQPQNESVVVTVSSAPAMLALNDLEFCYGEIAPEIIFSSAAAGITYSWTNSNPDIGLGASGVGNIPVFMTRNNTDNSITSVITVTPSSGGCNGVSRTFNITVRPPVIIFTPGDQTICSGENTAEVVLRSNTIGAVFKWSAIVPAGITGMTATTGTNTIPVQTLVNSTDEPIIVTYKAMATSPGINDCEWVEYSYTVTVNPMPVVTGPFNQSICSSSYFNVIPEQGNGNSIPRGIGYTWGNPVISPAGSITGANSQLTPLSAISQTLVNTSSAIATVTYRVTPIANGCEGMPFEVIVTVNPQPTVNIVNNIILCNDEQNVEVVFSGNVPGTVYRWSSDNANIGMVDAGTGNIPSFRAVNNTTLPITTTISVMPMVDDGILSCDGTTMQYTITVNPTGQVNNPGDQTACAGNNISVNFTTNNNGGIITYEWTNSNTNIGLAASGTGNISFVTVNSGSTLMTTSITVVPVFTNNGGWCTGNPEIFTLDVYPTAMVDVPADQELCNGETTNEVRFTGNVSNATYQWTNDNPSIGLAAVGTGDIASFTAVNNGPVPVVAIITVTTVERNCNGNPVSFKITVNPSPHLNQQPLSNTICLGETTPALFVAAVNGRGTPSYQWYSNTIYSKVGSSLIPGATNASYDPPVTVAGILYYYCEITFPSVGCNWLSSEIASVTIHPNPVISAISLEINSGEVFTVVPVGINGNIVPPGTTYTWSEPVVDPANALSGATAQTEPQTSISQQLVNNTTGAVTVTYNVTPTSGSCSGVTFQVIIRVKNELTTNAVVNPVSCIGRNDGSITTNIEGGVPFSNGAPYIILWTGPNGFTSSAATISNLSPGDYSLTITDATGIAFSGSYTITAPDEIILVTDSVNGITCYGAADGEIAISVTGGTGAYQISWTKDNQPFGTSEDITNLEPGNYVVTVTDALNCIPKTLIHVITQPDLLVVTLKEKADILCFNDSTGSIRINVSGGVPDYSYAWTGPNGFTSIDMNLDNLRAGIYNLMVTDENGCRQPLSVAITEPLPLRVTSAITPISCFGANDASASISIVGGTPPYNAVWDNGITGTNQDSLAAGNYTVIITDANRCQISTTISITEAPTFTVRPVVRNISCNGEQNGSIALNFESASNEIILTWSDNNSAGSTRSNLGPGTYTVSFNMTGRSLCDNSRTFVITEPLPLALTGSVTHIVDCINDNNGAIGLTINGGTPPYRYSWSNGGITEDLTGLSAGNYVVTVTDSLGCSRIVSYTVNRPIPLEVNVNSILDYNCNSKEVVAVSNANVTGGMPPYQLTWSYGEVSGTSNEIMQTTQSGTILLTVVDALGCSANHTFNVQIPESGVESQLLDCNNHSYQFTPSVRGYSSDKITYHWDFGDGTTSDLKNPVHTYQTAGRYHVVLSIAIANSCTSTYEEYIDVEFPPLVGIDKEAKFCFGDSILIYGTGADSYRWNDGSTGDSLWISAVGNYSVTGTTEAGCEAIYTFPASYYDLINYTIQSDYQEVSGGQDRIHFWTQNTLNSSYTWDFGDGDIGHGSDNFHTYEITEDGYIDIKLRVINPFGCIEETTKRIWKTITAIPNTFTPNGDDINDIYLRGWMIEVFNRNGILMYKGEDGWDGKHNDSPVNNDTYFVIVYDSTFMGAKYKTTYVTVLR